MAQKLTITGEIAKQYLTLFPDYPALTLAKKVYKENPEVFTSVEHARTTIRLHLGQMGDLNRSRAKDKQFFRDPRDTNPFKLPDSEVEDWTPFLLPESANKNLIFSDGHFPFHDIRAITAMLDHAVGRGINSIIMNGDMLDFYQLSRFMKDPRKRSINDEIWGLVEFINILQETFPGVRIFYKIANHEERLQRYLMVKAPELLSMTEFKLTEILKMRGVENVTYIENQIMYAARLPIVHGHEFMGGGSGTVNPARNLALKTFSSSMTSHFHRTSSHTESDINEKVMSWFSIGCLCGLHPDYARINKWNHGFAYIDTDGRDFSVNNHKIYKGKVYTE
jgi:hypothetical protein